MDEESATLEPPPVIENSQPVSRGLAWLAVGLLVAWYVLELGRMGYSYSVQLQVEEIRSGGFTAGGSYLVQELYENIRTVLGIASVPIILLWTAALVCLALTERQTVSKKWWMAMVGVAVVMGLIYLGMSMYVTLLQGIFVDWLDEHYQTAQIFLRLVTLGLGLGLMLIGWLCLMLPPAFGKPTRPAPTA